MLKKRVFVVIQLIFISHRKNLSFENVNSMSLKLGGVGGLVFTLKYFYKLQLLYHIPYNKNGLLQFICTQALSLLWTLKF